VIHFELNIQPQAKQADRSFFSRGLGRIMHYQTSRVRRHADLMAAHLERYRPAEPMTGPIALTVVLMWKATKDYPAGFRDGRPDYDNCAKQTADVLQRCGFIADDAQICRATIWKRAGRRAGMVIRLECLTEQNWVDWKKEFRHGNDWVDCNEEKVSDGQASEVRNEQVEETEVVRRCAV